MVFPDNLTDVCQLPDWRLSRRLQQLLEFAFVGLVDLLSPVPRPRNRSAGVLVCPASECGDATVFYGAGCTAKYCGASDPAHFSVAQARRLECWVGVLRRADGSRPIAARETLTNNLSQSAERDPGAHSGCHRGSGGCVVEQTRIIGKLDAATSMNGM